jgi:hypothetical protein
MKLSFLSLPLFLALGLAQPENTLFARQTSNSTECSNPQPNDCSFYAECVEARYHCGSTGYPLDYGQKYCQKSLDDASLLSTAGQAWATNVMLCLQRHLAPYDLGGNQTFASCTALSDYAFSTHPTCYVQGGLCTLPVTDWETIVFKIVGVNTLFDSWDAIKTTIEAAAGCGEFYLWAIAHGVF